MDSLKQQKEDDNSEKKVILEGDGEKQVTETDETSQTEKDNSKKEDQDVVFVQDVGFTVKITAPGVEPLDIQVISFV